MTDPVGVHEAPLDSVMEAGRGREACMKSSRLDEAKLSSAMMMPPTEACWDACALLERDSLCNRENLVTC